jgi:hypothetical protein
MVDTRMLGDRYELSSALGSGGMATVFAATDRVLGRPVAIKLLAEKYAGDDKFVTRFQREARSAANLNHRNIVSVYDTGDTDGQHYIVMELVKGETLADLLRREGPLSPTRAARIGSAVSRALQAAHDQGLVHRDVKPGNVMITPAGDVKVMDFGIARAATDDTLTQTGIVLGTASYLSPEQSRGDPVDHRSDVYSLGCVLYEMLTGQPPFSATSPISVAYKHVNERPRPPSDINGAVPPGLEAVIMRALEKDPASRFTSAEDLGDALTGAAADETTEPLAGDTAVLPATTTPIEVTSPGRKPWILLAIVAAGLALGIVAAFLLGDGDRPGREGRERQEQKAPEPTVTTPPPVVDLAAAVAGLQEHVSAAYESGELDEDVAKRIIEEADKATEEYSKGELEKAVEHLGQAETAIQVGLLEETLSSDLATLLMNDVSAIRAAMAAGAPTVEEEGESDEDSSGDSGPGNSENAPGQVKKEEEDD